MPDFIPGLELARRFYWEAVRPTLDAEYPGLRHAAALIGAGSEVLGFDTEQSTDHHWGPRAMLFLVEDDYSRLRERIFETFRWRLPHKFLGYPTNFAQPVPEDPGTRLLKETESGPIDHRVEVYTVRGFVLDYLGCDLQDELTPADWLSFPQQRLRAFTGGAVYHDEVGLAEARARFAYYPRDVWLTMLASGWARIGQEEHLMGRAGQAGDDTGSRIIAARLVRDAMSLCFLMERQYAPYAKWYGTGFMRLDAGPALGPMLTRVLRAEAWPERGEALARVYEFLAAKHNTLGLTAALDEQTSAFWGRPFPVIHGDRFAAALLAEVGDPFLRSLAGDAPTGNVDQISDNTNVLENTPRHVIKALFEREDQP
jgi:hypothetical protein